MGTVWSILKAETAAPERKSTMARKHRYSPAAVRLMTASVSARDVAVQLGVSQPVIVYWLRGSRPKVTTDDAIRAVVAEMGGQALADEVYALVLQARAARDDDEDQEEAA
jgi:Arc/MetJ family transcription regulator